MTLTDAQRELLEDKHSLWVRAAETGQPDLRDYNRRAADALRVALSLASSASAAEARVGVLEGLIRQMHDEYDRDEACDYRKINGYISALFQALTQEPTP